MHLLAAAVKLRAAQPDCFAGTVFRVEPSSYCSSLADGALSIVRGLRNEDVMVVIIKVWSLGLLPAHPSMQIL